MSHMKRGEAKEKMTTKNPPKMTNTKPVRKNKKSMELSSKTEVESAFKFLAGD